MQASGKAPKPAKGKPPAKPAAASGTKVGTKGKDISTGQAVDAAAQRDQEAALLAAVQSVLSGSAGDTAGAEDRLMVMTNNAHMICTAICGGECNLSSSSTENLKSPWQFGILYLMWPWM